MRLFFLMIFGILTNLSAMEEEMADPMKKKECMIKTIEVQGLPKIYTISLVVPNILANITQPDSLDKQTIIENLSDNDVIIFSATTNNYKITYNPDNWENGIHNLTNLPEGEFVKIKNRTGTFISYYLSKQEPNGERNTLIFSNTEIEMPSEENHQITKLIVSVGIGELPDINISISK